MAELRRGGFLISKVHQLAGRAFARKLKAHGIHDVNPAQGRILFALWQEDGVPIETLARRTGLGPSTLTRMLDNLERAGHLSRVASETDRRKQIIRLTKTHHSLRRSYDEVSAEMTDLFYQGFAEAEIDAFESFLERILQNLGDATGGATGGAAGGAGAGRKRT